MAKQNVELSYLYRDGGNYKRYGSVVFTNASKIDVEYARTVLKTTLIDNTFFDAASFRLPTLYFNEYAFNPDLDHSWHEIDRLSETDHVASDTHGRDFSEFLNESRR